MKILVLALITVMAAVTDIGQAATYGDTEEAFQDCRLYLESGRELTAEESIRANSCVNFVIGAWDMGEYISWRSAFLGTDPPFCPPKQKVDVAQPIQAFISYVEEHPEKMEHRLAMVLEWSFQEAYPCTTDYYIKLVN